MDLIENTDIFSLIRDLIDIRTYIILLTSSKTLVKLDNDTIGTINIVNKLKEKQKKSNLIETIIDLETIHTIKFLEYYIGDFDKIEVNYYFKYTILSLNPNINILYRIAEKLYTHVFINYDYIDFVIKYDLLSERSGVILNRIYEKYHPKKIRQNILNIDDKIKNTIIIANPGKNIKQYMYHFYYHDYLDFFDKAFIDNNKDVILDMINNKHINQHNICDIIKNIIFQNNTRENTTQFFIKLLHCKNISINTSDMIYEIGKNFRKINPANLKIIIDSTSVPSIEINRLVKIILESGKIYSDLIIVLYHNQTIFNKPLVCLKYFLETFPDQSLEDFIRIIEWINDKKMSNKQILIFCNKLPEFDFDILYELACRDNFIEIAEDIINSHSKEISTFAEYGFKTALIYSIFNLCKLILSLAKNKIDSYVKKNINDMVSKYFIKSDNIEAIKFTIENFNLSEDDILSFLRKSKTFKSDMIKIIKKDSYKIFEWITKKYPNVIDMIIVKKSCLCDNPCKCYRKKSTIEYLACKNLSYNISKLLLKRKSDGMKHVFLFYIENNHYIDTQSGISSYLLLNNLEFIEDIRIRC